jgi:Uma2 family endonuclease
MTLVKTGVTADELLRLTDDRQKYELARGELITMTPTGGEHGEIAGAVFFALKSYVKSKKLGQVYTAETGFLLTTDPDTVRAPDAAYVSTARHKGVQGVAGFVPLAPDLAVEVVSPNDSAQMIQEKVNDFLAAGTRQVWVVYPRTRTVMVHYSLSDAHVFMRDEAIDGGDMLPGFSCKVSEFFE